MLNYWITEEQLNRLSLLNPEWPDQVEEREQLVDVVRTQILDQDSGSGLRMNTDLSDAAFLDYQAQYWEQHHNYAHFGGACWQECRRRTEPLLKAAVQALRSYQYGNDSPDLAKEIADKIEDSYGRLQTHQ